MYSLALIAFLLVLYSIIAWLFMRRENPLLKVNSETQIINLGSTYAYYDIDYGNFNINGVNLANFPQYLDYDYIILKKVIKKLKCGTKIVLTFPDFVFAGSGTQPIRRQYYEVLKPWEMKNFSLIAFISYLYRAAIEPITHSYQKEKNKWKGYVATYDDKCRFAQKRIKDWEDTNGQVKIPSVRKAEITNGHLKIIEANKAIVMDMLDLCIQYGMKPYILIFPVSDIMKKEIADECLEVYLRKPISDILQKVRYRNYDVVFLDYSNNIELSDMDLYMNGDCFNQQGRQKFTGIILRDVGLLSI